MKKKSFWVTNTCNRNVSLSDLYLTIKAYSSVNLLDSKHYYYTLEQLEKSAVSGSLFKKRKLISIRNVEPDFKKVKKNIVNETYITSRQRSILDIKEDIYEELNVTDEEFAKENSDLTD